MKHTLPILLAAAAIALTGCQTLNVRPVYDPVGYKPKNPSNVRVKVSLQNRMVYVLEGDKPLLVTATAIGLPAKPTPKGNFRVIEKIENKRSGSYGFWVNGNSIIAGTSGQCPGGSYHYVGFPMQYWVGFSPGYGFHVGSVWPTPRTHGCLRIHENAARELYEIVRIGTPVNIAQTQPEDATLGKNPPRPQDYNDPDPPKSLTISSAVFKKDPNDIPRDQP
ncbi:MAG: murein L,D-transpeptidase [Verrucomicrobiaceae bacterium]|nr:MAG: murein L,D-transpeptidase [Verrucomicrobiaceae bacterium]